MFKNLFFKFDEYKIEKFQLENLATSLIPFSFFSLDKIESKTRLTDRAIFISDVLVELEKEPINKEAPLIFICNNGKKSKKAVKLALEKGFTNVYFVEGGFSLLSQ